TARGALEIDNPLLTADPFAVNIVEEKVLATGPCPAPRVRPNFFANGVVDVMGVEERNMVGLPLRVSNFEKLRLAAMMNELGVEPGHGVDLCFAQMSEPSDFTRRTDAED